MTVLSKIRWVASILLVFTIVLITNLIDKDNFRKLSDAVTTIYEDRIVASDLIFEMSRIIQAKEIAVVTGDTAFFQSKNDALNRETDVLIEGYEETKLTKKEQFVFDQLTEELKTLRSQEQKFQGELTGDLQKSLDSINGHLYDLAKIQLQEGRRQVFISDQAKYTLDLFARGEIIFLIIVAILVQIIILYKPKKIVGD